MGAGARQSFNPVRSGAGFVVVVLAAYASSVTTLAYGSRPFSLPRAVALAAAGLAFLVLGTYGYAVCRRAGSVKSALAYFATQILLAGAIIYSTFGAPLFMMMLPLASQSVVLLPRRWTLTVCGVMLAVTVALDAGRFNLAAAAVRGVLFLAGIIFVVVFTQIAVNERRARAEVERLAAELGAANHKLRQYAAQAEELATVRERNRLAREIHDSLGHYLTVINVQLEAARAVIDGDRRRALDALSKAQSLAQEGLGDVRRSVAALRAAPVDSRPLPEAVAALVDECRAAGIATDLVVSGEPRRLPSQAELTLYRAAQEGLTNVRKHARASRAHLTLDYRAAAAVRLVVQDNGAGGTSAESGFGLLGVRERAQLLGGQVGISTAAGQGFTLEVELPG